MSLWIYLGCFTPFPEIEFPPVLTIEQPEEDYRIPDGKVYNAGELIPFLLKIFDPDSGVEDIIVTIQSNIDGTLFEGLPDAEGRVSILESTLQTGLHQMTITVVEGDHLISNTFPLLVNATPVISELMILPEEPTTVDDLYADVVSVTDQEGDETELTIEWLLSGVVEPDEDGVSLSAEKTSKNQRWMVRITPRDIHGEGEPVTANVLIGDSIPVAGNIEITPSEDVYNDQELLCTASITDSDGDDFDAEFVWAILTEDWEVLDYNATFTPVPSIIQPGMRLYCGISFDDIPTSDIDKQFVDIANRDPVLSNIGINTPMGQGIGDQLSCHANVLDPDQTPATVQYRLGHHCTTGSPASGTLLSQSGSQNPDQDFVIHSMIATKGDQITCLAIGMDEYGGETEVTATITVENSLPNIDVAGVVLDPIDPFSNQDITCTAVGVDPDQDVVTNQYAWTINGVLVTGGKCSDTQYTAEVDCTTASETWSGNILSSTTSSFGVGDDIQCSVTPIDSEPATGTTVSNAVTIQNSPPVVDSISIVNDP